MIEQSPIYLDHSATTPLDERVLQAMMPYFSEGFGNASSIHQVGRTAERAINHARATIANILNCKPSEIVFTSGGSESDNLAIRGGAWAQRQKGLAHLVTSPVEHSAITNTIKQLSDLQGFEQSIAPVDAYGIVSVESLQNTITQQTALVSIVYANNEVGSINPISAFRNVLPSPILLHTDAVQAGGQLELDVQKLGVDLLSLSAHKFYGPKGIGILYVREGIELQPSQTGGSHENGRRAGTYNTPGIIGIAKALELAYLENAERVTYLTTLREQLINGICRTIPDAYLTGHRTNRLPSHVSFVFDGVEANTLLIHLDLKGVYASSGSACKTGNPTPSNVLLAMGFSHDLALSGLRLTVGLHNTPQDIEIAVQTIATAVERIRHLG
ncbi:MAG: cysteine desulfurase family protein [Phototrophicaceae bacterium]